MKKKRHNIKTVMAGALSMSWIMIFCSFTLGWSQSHSVSEKSDILVSRVSQETPISTMNQVISIDFEDVPLLEALKRITKELEMELSYSKEVLPIHKKVTADFEGTTANEVIYTLLEGTGLRYAISTKGSLVLFEYLGGPRKFQASEQALQSVSGTVTDAENGETLPGVNILVKGTETGISTDEDGNYELEVPSLQDTLIFSFIGYQTTEVSLNGRTTINVDLQPQALTGEELVVTGYGSVQKSDLTGSISKVEEGTITSTPTTRLDEVLRGKVAGFRAVPTTSEPGAASSIRIRGSNSIQANNEPLFVVDGVIGGFSLNDINVNNIESVEVLKDASATALYGSRGSNGVIIITTKRGEVGTPLVSYETYASWKSPNRFIDMLNGEEYARFQNENAGPDITLWPDPSSYGDGTNWQKEVWRDNALTLNHALTISGGNEANRYFISGNYLDEEGIGLNSEIERYQFRINTNHDIGEKLDIGTSILLNKRNQAPGVYALSSNVGLNNDILGWFPTLSIYDEEGNPTQQISTPELINDNPVTLAMVPIHNNLTNKLIGNVFGEYDFISNHLTYKISLSANIQEFRGENYFPASLYQERATNGTASVNRRRTEDFLQEHTLNFTQDFGKHSINALVGYTRQTITTKGSFVEAEGFATDHFTFNNLGTAKERTGANSNLDEQGIESYLVRTQYNYDDKYLLTLSGRLDGNSVFAKENKYGIFPSVALAWRMSNEDFIQDLNVFDELKLRASWGILGNPGLNPGASLARINQAGNNYILGTSQSVVTGLAQNSIGNPNLKWETTTQLNVGVDAEFVNNRLQVSVDYYDKMTDDLLVNVPILWITGFENSLSNFGSISNKGLEVNVSSVNIDQGDFLWETNFNIASNRNIVEEIRAPEGFIFTNSIRNGPTGLLQEGHPIGTFYGMVQDGIWNSQDEIVASGLSGFAVFPGGKRYKDLNGDNVINQTDDSQIIGNAEPDFYGGIGNTLSYKNFSLYVFVSFVYGNDIFNETNHLHAQAFDSNIFGKFANRWTPDNTDTNIPSLAGIQRSQIVSTTEFVEDGSFLRVRDLRLSYNVPVSNLDFLRSATIYISGTNVFLLDSYSGYDPEINRGSNNTRRGFDISQDPTARAVTAGLKLDF